MMVWRALSRISRDVRGSAGAEMALVAPMLVFLMFGSAEMGNFFLDQHIVTKAVRDGARYAARLPVSNYSCSAASGAAETKIRNVTRTGTDSGTLATGENARLGYWADTMDGNQTITISVTCDTTYAGIYTGLTGGVRIVTVSAAVPYPSLFGLFGLRSDHAYKLNASSQAAVMGL